MQFSANSVPCNVYVDAQNIRIALESAGLSSEFDPRKLTSLIEAQALGGRSLVIMRTHFYDTVNPYGSEEERERDRSYLDRVEQLPDTHVITGTTGGSGRQKGIDVQLATDALEAAWSGRIGAIAIVSGDGDFAPLATAIRRAGPHVLVLAFEEALSNELRVAADRVLVLPRKPNGWQLEA